MSKDDEVGYGKPPKHTQFKPGHSGNPKGRPPGSKNMGIRRKLEKALKMKTPVMEDGERREISKLEAGLWHFANKVAKGDHRSLELLLKYQQLYELMEETRLDEKKNWPGGVLVAPADMTPEEWIEQEQKNNDKKREKMIWEQIAQGKLEQEDAVEETSAPEKTKQISVINSF